MTSLIRFVFIPQLMEDTFDEYPELKEYHKIIDEYVESRLNDDIYHDIFSNIMFYCDMKLFHIAYISHKVHVWAVKKDRTPITKKDIENAIEVITEQGPDLWMEGDITAVPADFLSEHMDYTKLGFTSEEDISKEDVYIELDPQLEGIYVEKEIVI